MAKDITIRGCRPMPLAQDRPIKQSGGVMDKMLALQHELASLYRRLAQVICDMNDITCKDFAAGGDPKLLVLNTIRTDLERRVKEVRKEINVGWGQYSVNGTDSASFNPVQPD
jgi:hypothetical protein